MAELKREGWKQVAADRRLAEIAEANGETPQAVYLAIRKLEAPETVMLPPQVTEQAVEKAFADSGVGNKSLREVAARVDADPQRLVERLERKGIDVDPSAAIKAAAARQGLAPLELLKAALIEDYVPAARR